ncbi:MAG: hypothetical protein OXU20_42005 [Myxococcales bacterium]|nr:hypothetical protein [Myxococcales bacterium]
MPTTGLVVTIEGDEPSIAIATGVLGALAGVTLGTLHGARCPVVVETDDLAGHERVLQAVQRVSGVLACELAFADFSDVQDPAGGRVGPRREGVQHGSS